MQHRSSGLRAWRPESAHWTTVTAAGNELLRTEGEGEGGACGCGATWEQWTGMCDWRQSEGKQGWWGKCCCAFSVQDHCFCSTSPIEILPVNKLIQLSGTLWRVFGNLLQVPSRGDIMISIGRGSRYLSHLAGHTHSSQKRVWYVYVGDEMALLKRCLVTLLNH